MVGGRVEREGEDAGGAGLCSEKWGSGEKPWVRVSPRLCELWDAPGSRRRSGLPSPLWAPVSPAMVPRPVPPGVLFLGSSSLWRLQHM